MRARGMLLIFALTLLCSAGLLFVLEPLIGKTVLPRLGGSPAVWNSCVVFFQAVLLAGYAYAHASCAWLGPRRQALLQLAVLACCLLFLLAWPLRLHETLLDDAGSSPVLSLLLCLAVSYGVPLFVVCSSAPLLQKWFSASDHPAAADPYFLYGASNLGSMLALIAYPALIEPGLTLQRQRYLCLAGYVVLTFLCAGCAYCLWRSQPAKEAEQGTSRPAEGAVSVQRRLRWVALAFAPSSLMLGVTTYITTDIAAIPFLWILPLALYLHSFILVYSRMPAGVHRGLLLVMPPLVLAVLVLMLAHIELDSLPLTIGIHLLTLFVVSMVCHGELAHDRPPTRYLTGYFLWISVGGVLGGLFNSLLAPLLYPALEEYPLVLGAVCLLLPPGRLLFFPGARWARVAVVACLLAAVLITPPLLNPSFGSAAGHSSADSSWLAASTPLWLGMAMSLSSALRARRDFRNAWLDFLLPLIVAALSVGLLWGVDPTRSKPRELLWLFGIPALACYAFVNRPLRFGMSVCYFVVVALTSSEAADHALFRGRSFFGTLTVGEKTRTYGDEELTYRYLMHGSTPHGRQFLRPNLRDVPITYYDRTGPVGQLFTSCNTRPERNIGVIGLGTGTLACYALPGQHMTFYDIDPLIRDLAFGDDAYFTFVADARQRGARIDLVLGDARVEMAKQQMDEKEKYGILVVDAFSSDAIPVHLITREALGVYLDHLASDGLLAFHISNQHLDLEPVLANIAQDLGLAGLFQRDRGGDVPSKLTTRWVLLARKPEHFHCLKEPERWRPLQPAPRVGVWTDDYCNVLSVLDW